MEDEIKVKFVVCSACDQAFPACDLPRREHEFEAEDGGLLVVYDYYCPQCQAKLASWGTT
jgi:hypothetical protein